MQRLPASTIFAQPDEPPLNATKIFLASTVVNQRQISGPSGRNSWGESDSKLWHLRAQIFPAHDLEEVFMKSNNGTLVLALLATILAIPTANAARNYNYLEGGYVRLDDESSDDEDGARMAGSADILKDVALFGEYADTGPFEQATFGALYHPALDEYMDLNLGLSVEQAEFGSIDDTGFGARAGVRWQVAENGFEINPEIRYVDVLDDGRTSARVGALMPFGQNLAAVGAVQGGDDDRLELGLRYQFGSQPGNAR
jgi:hypothetical protein